MPTAEAHVNTNRASRYLAQLCQHLDQLSQRRRHGPAGDVGHGPDLRSVEWNDERGSIVFGAGRCDLAADAAGLTVRVTADDVQALRYLQEMFAARLEMIGRRDHLRVAW